MVGKLPLARDGVLLIMRVRVHVGHVSSIFKFSLSRVLRTNQLMSSS